MCLFCTVTFISELIAKRHRHRREIWPLCDFCSVPFFRAHAWRKKNLWTDLHYRWLKTREIRQGCAYWEFCHKSFTPTPNIPQIPTKIALPKQFFAQNTYKSWRKSCQNSYSNRKQPRGSSKLGLVIWPEVVLWPLRRMRSRKLAKIPEIMV